MTSNEIHSSLVYLDREFVAGKYEIISGKPASSQITKAQGGKAGLEIPIFSAEVSSIETRTYPISTLKMIETVIPEIENDKSVITSGPEQGACSKYGWVTAKLGTMTGKLVRGIPDTENYSESEQQGCFTLRNDGLKLALITTPDYFVSGLDALLKMHQVALRDSEMPVRAFVRVIAVQNHLNDWIAIPYLMYGYS